MESNPKTKIVTTMQQHHLLIPKFLEHGTLYHPNQEIVSLVEHEGTYRSTYAKTLTRVKQLANALLTEFQVQQGDVIATLAWNTHRHYELYYAVSGLGAVIHTVNPRLFLDQVEYILNDGEAKVLFFDSSLTPLVLKLKEKLKHVQRFVVLTSRPHMPDPASDPLTALCYEDLVHRHSDRLEWPSFDENQASSLCYTSGTTGQPKGVVYSHRSTLLHTLVNCNTDMYGLSQKDSLLVLVPLFHVNAWGLPYSATMQGAKIVFTGINTDGKTLFNVMQQEKVTITFGVPTLWRNLLNFVDLELKDRKEGKLLPYLSRVLVGGSAAPEVQVKRFRDDFGVKLVHGWGMTEMSPVGTINYGLEEPEMTQEEELRLALKQGRPPFGVEMKIVDQEGKELPKDGVSCGRILVRGPWITDSYHKQGKITDEQGWMETGDVGTLDARGILEITDREKDVIKSGGEWISSVAIENHLKGFPGVDDAAVVGVYHPKWEERPIAVVVMKKGQTATKEDITKFLEGLIAKWWMPDDFIFVESIPYQATGKVFKRELRDKFKDHLRSRV